MGLGSFSTAAARQRSGLARADFSDGCGLIQERGPLRRGVVFLLLISVDMKDPIRVAKAGEGGNDK